MGSPLRGKRKSSAAGSGQIPRLRIACFVSVMEGSMLTKARPRVKHEYPVHPCRIAWVGDRHDLFVTGLIVIRYIKWQSWNPVD